MDYPMTLLGLPPLPRSLNGYHNMNTGSPLQQPMSQIHLQQQQHSPLAMRSQSDLKYFRRISPGPTHQSSPPIPPPRPNHGSHGQHRHSRHSHSGSSSASSSSAFIGLGHGHSPDHHYSVNRTIQQHASEMKPSSSPARSLSSSPHSPHNIDSGLGRSSADSSEVYMDGGNNEPRAFVRVIKSPHHLIAPTTNLDSQLSQLKKDMHQLRQMDMALLGHLLSIHQGIQDLRNVLIPPPPPVPGPVYRNEHPSSSSAMYHRHGHDMNMSFPMLISRSEKARGRKLVSRRDRGNDEDEQSDSLSSIEFGDV